MIVPIKNKEVSWGESDTYWVGLAKVEGEKQLVIFTKTEIDKAIDRSSKKPDIRLPKKGFLKNLFS